MNHIEEGLAKVISRYKSDSRFNTWLATMLRQIQDVEDAMQQVIASQDITTATGAVLDLFGTYLDESRGALATDDDYRDVLVFKVIASSQSNNWSDFWLLFFEPNDLTSALVNALGVAELELKSGSVRCMLFSYNAQQENITRDIRMSQIMNKTAPTGCRFMIMGPAPSFAFNFATNSGRMGDASNPDSVAQNYLMRGLYA